jgi:hypothetical protein
MKNFIFFFSLLILSIQMSLSQNVFTKIPTPPHTHEVDIFFPHELPIKEPYFKTQMIEVQGGSSYNNLILILKDRARLMGADGVIITDKDGDYLAGIGIKYKRIDSSDSTKTLTSKRSYSIDSLKVIKKISIIPIGNKLISGDVLFEMDGSIKTGQPAALVNYFIDNVFQYDFKFLVEDKSQRWKEFNDINGRVITRRFFKTVSEYGYLSDKQKVVRINYDRTYGFGLIESLIVSDKIVSNNDAEDEWKKEKLVPTMNEKGVMTNLRVYWKDAIVRHQKLFYDASGKLIMADWSRFEKGIEKPFLRVEYQYYKDTDLPK